MSRISIDVTPGEHQKLKPMAALQGKSIKDDASGRTLGREVDDTAQAALIELESLLDKRLESAQKGAVSKQTVGAIFKEVFRKAGTH